MPINVRKTAVHLAVICFFGLSIVTLISGLTPFVCCKRAIAGAVLVYIAANVAVRLINMILVDAIVGNRVEELNNSQQEQKRNQRSGR